MLQYDQGATRRRRFNRKIATSIQPGEYDDLVPPGSLTGRSSVYRPPPQCEEALVRRKDYPGVDKDVLDFYWSVSARRHLQVKPL